MKVLGLDVGDKTIGVAVSDVMGIVAQGLKTIERVGIKRDTSDVMQLIKEYDCKKVVIGLPINLDGSNSIQTEKVYVFKEKLENKLRSHGLLEIELIFEDERFTTKIAENILIEGNVSRKKRKEVIDKQAATIILQSYLDKVRR